jgi:hypothetical protein
MLKLIVVTLFLVGPVLVFSDEKPRETQFSCVATGGLTYTLRASAKSLTLRVHEAGSQYTIPITRETDITSTKSGVFGFFFPMAGKDQGVSVKLLKRGDDRDLASVATPKDVVAAVTESGSTFGGPVEMLLQFEGGPTQNSQKLGGGLAECFVPSGIPARGT